MNRKTNKLVNEKSPYLLQHAYNPVEWYPWNEEAFKKAEEENKPIFLSIGYSTCHWCHVMERESFEDDEVAEILNKNFISIKVDREERPDVDSIYMHVCQMMTGSGGWPLTIFLTPDKKPFYAGTYFPKHSRYNRIGLMELLTRISQLWQSEKDEIINSAEQITIALQTNKESEGDKTIGVETIHKAFIQFKNSYDEQRGGFGTAPKFPSPHNFIFLVRYFFLTGNEDAINMSKHTLKEMRKGGIFDQIGFGFHRYSTDEKWLLPHFEKMLYDQALLLISFSELYTVAKDNFFSNVVNEIVEYVERELTSDEGGFFCAEDADSEGEEGKFYLWTEKEIDEILLDKSQLIKNIFNIKPVGNFADPFKGNVLTGENILHLTKTLEEISDEFKIPIEQLKDELFSSANILFNERNKRIHPHKDDKILCDWNGLMIASLAIAGRLLNNQKYISLAEKGINFFYNHLLRNEFIFHRYRDSEVAISGFLDDYAFIIFALIELYKSTFEIKYLSDAIKFTQKAEELFWDETNGGFFSSGKHNEELISKRKEIYDGAIPSGNSIMLNNYSSLFHLTGNFDYKEKGEKICKYFATQVESTPVYFSMFISGWLLLQSNAELIVVTTKSINEQTLQKINRINEVFNPYRFILIKTEENNSLIEKISLFTKGMKFNDTEIFYYCKNFKCNLPEDNIDVLIDKLKNK